MAINILDDEVINQNRTLISSIENTKGIVETTEESVRTSDSVEITISDKAKETKYKDLYNERTQRTISDDSTSSVSIADITTINKNDRASDELSIDSLVNFTYKEIYENDFWKANNWFGEGRAKVQGSNTKQVTVNTQNLEFRENLNGTTDIFNTGVEINKNELREMAIFLYMLFPYIGTSVVIEARNAIADPNIAGLVMSASVNLYDTMTKMRYYTPQELALYFGHNFYTLRFFKQMTIKYPPGSFPSGVPNAKRWFGAPDILFGQGSSIIEVFKKWKKVGIGLNLELFDGDDGSSALTKYKDGGKESGDSTDLPNAAHPLSPIIELTPYYANSYLIQNPKGILNEKVSNSALSPQAEFYGPISFSLPIFNDLRGKWNLSDAREDVYAAASSKIRIAKIDGDLLRDFYLNPDVEKITSLKIEPANKWEETEDRENIGISSVRERAPSLLEDFYLNPDVEKITSLKRKPADKWKETTETEEIEISDVGTRKTSEEKDFYINKDVFFIEFPENKLLSSKDWDGNSDRKKAKISDIINNKSKNEIGFVLVKPIVPDDVDLPRFEIPFEFNPMIDEGDLAANYEATSILSRIGELQSYSNSGNLTVSLTTKYLAVSADGQDSGTDGQSWMNDFTLKKIQAIEYAYRSLVLPHHPDGTDEEQGYKYIKPPIIRIVIGEDEEQDGVGPFSNLLRYTKTMTDNRLNSSQKIFGDKNYRNFIATSVKITKNLEESPLVLSNSGKIMDTMGFEVSLNLTEVTTSYSDRMPDYKRYYNQFKSSFA